MPEPLLIQTTLTSSTAVVRRSIIRAEKWKEKKNGLPCWTFHLHQSTTHTPARHDAVESQSNSLIWKKTIFPILPCTHNRLQRCENEPWCPYSPYGFLLAPQCKLLRRRHEWVWMGRWVVCRGKGLSWELGFLRQGSQPEVLRVSNEQCSAPWDNNESRAVLKINKLLELSVVSFIEK